MIKEYLTYIKDNPEGYWFKAKCFGWGWTPAKWQGWVVLLGFIAYIIFNFYRIDSASPSASDTLDNFVPQTIILVALLLIICWKKGEKPRWRWGVPKEYYKSKDTVEQSNKNL